MVTGRDRPLQRHSQAPQLPKGNLSDTEGSHGRDRLVGPVPTRFLALGLQCVLSLRSLPEATPPPSTGWLLGELRGCIAFTEVQPAEGGQNHGNTDRGPRGLDWSGRKASKGGLDIGFNNDLLQNCKGGYFGGSWGNGASLQARIFLRAGN